MGALDIKLHALGALVAIALLSPWLWSIAVAAGLSSPRRVLGMIGATLACWMLLIAVSWLTARFHQWAGSGDTSTLQTKMVDAMVRTGASEYGAWAVFVMVAVLTPILEELVFRGLLLAGLTRHIGFAWANLAQAVLFSSIHADPPRFVFYLALGWLAGWLVRRYRSLWPAVLLHVLNNALATWATL